MALGIGCCTPYIGLGGIGAFQLRPVGTIGKGGAVVIGALVVVTGVAIGLDDGWRFKQSA